MKQLRKLRAVASVIAVTSLAAHSCSRAWARRTRTGGITIIPTVDTTTAATAGTTTVRVNITTITVTTTTKVVERSSCRPPADSSNDGSSCDAATFSTIQSAVDAASAGDTVVVCAGTYPEDVVVSTPLTLVGDDAVIQGVPTTDRDVRPARPQWSGQRAVPRRRDDQELVSVDQRVHGSGRDR